MKKKKLGERLVETGKVSAADLETALREQRGTTILLGDLLVARGILSKEDLAATLPEILMVDYIDLGTVDLDPEVLKLIPHRIAARYIALPLYREGKKLVVAMADPRDLDALDQLKFLSAMEISPRLSFRDDISEAIERHYGDSPAHNNRKSTGSHSRTTHIGKVPEAPLSDSAVSRVFTRTSPELMHSIKDLGAENGIEFESMKFGSSDLSQAAQREIALAKQNLQTPAVRIVSSIVATAIQEGASDIHIDPHTEGAVVRIRVDGMLRDIADIPLDVQASLISRIKILGEMDIAERRAPQDGRILIRTDKARIDLRVSTLPTQYGEKAVIRLLNSKATKVDFKSLGLSETASTSLRKILAQPQGMLLVTGPTGSGKTTTLYASLNQLSTRTKNVITVEDPVEYMLEGINQVQVNAKAGRTFPNCLRSILRQDPNVIMVGEIRDLETAEIALSASQTGHLVLSTLHTNDSVAAIVRLLNLGIPAFLIASSLSAVIAQRLVRKLCSCRAEGALTAEFAAILLSSGVQDFGNRMYLPVGCPACKNIGYKGRVGIYEILFANEQTRVAIRTHGSPDEIRRTARMAGMKLMREEALEKAQSGETSLEEIFRVIPFENFSEALRCESCNRDVATTFLFCPYCGMKRQGIETLAEGSIVPAREDSRP
jgi:type IV pilus assembly protein PilB